MIEIAETMQQIAALLLASFPQLAGKIGEGAAGAAGGRIADGTLGLARKLWARVSGQLPDPKRLEHAALTAAAAPNDRDALTTFDQELRRQLEPVLRADPLLALELRAMLDRASSIEHNVGVQQVGPVYGGTAIGTGKVEYPRPIPPGESEA